MTAKENEKLRARFFLADSLRDGGGFTKIELLTVLAILGILIAIGIIVLLGFLERRRVNAATDQLVADMRLAHTSATNQLTDWRIVLVPEMEDEDEGPDYYLLRLTAPYPPGGGKPTPAERLPRTFPSDVKIVSITTASGTIVDDQSQTFWTAPWDPLPLDEPVPNTRTVEFNTNGTLWWSGAPSASTCVTVDSNPENRVYAQSATSRVRVEPDAC